MRKMDGIDRELARRLAELPELSCPPEVTARIEAAVAGQPQASVVERRRPRLPRWRWASFAVAAALATWILLARPAPEPRYTPAELALARAQAIEGLGVVVNVIETTQRDAVDEAIDRSVPSTLRAAVRKTLNWSEGGRG